MQYHPLIQHIKETRGRIAVVHLRAEIVDYQEVAVHDCILGLFLLLHIMPKRSRKAVEEICTGEIDHRMIAVHQCLRHAVDEEGLSGTRISHQDHVAMALIEVLRPVQQQIPDLRHILTVRLSARPIDQLPIIEACEIEVIEVLCPYDASKMGLLVDELHLHLLEAVTLLPTDETSILAVRAGILHLEIVCR